LTHIHQKPVTKHHGYWLHVQLQHKPVLWKEQKSSRLYPSF